MNYSELTDRITDGLHSDEASFVSHIPEFVKNAEEAILQKMEVYELRKTQTTTLVTGAAEITLPADFIAPYSLVVVNGTAHQNLLLKDETFVREAFPNPATTGVPRLYGITGSVSAVLGPAPGSAYTSILRYYYRPESIVTAGTTWLGTNAERALELGSKIEAYRYLKGDEDLMAEFKTAFQEALADLATIGVARPRTDSYRGVV